MRSSGRIVPSKVSLRIRSKMGESDYSFSLTTFSPSGKLVQIEYALNAVTAGATALGIKGASSNPRGPILRLSQQI